MKGMPLLAAWLLPFALFLFGGNKDVRYIAPILPAAALAIAFLMDSALPRSRMGTCSCRPAPRLPDAPDVRGIVRHPVSRRRRRVYSHVQQDFVAARRNIETHRS